MSASRSWLPSRGLPRLFLVFAPLLLALSPSAGARAEASSDGPEPPARRVLVLDLTAAGAKPEVARTLTHVVTAELARRSGYEVLSAEDLRRVVDLESTRQAMGCDEASCLAELAGALGADLVVFGEVGDLGEVTVLSLNLFDAGAARSRARAYVEVRDGQPVVDAARSAVAELLGDAPAPVATPAAAPPAEGGGALPLLIAGGATTGVSALALGGATLGALWADGVRADPKSLGESKDTAATVQVGSGVVAAAATVGVLVGAGLTFTALFVE